MDEDADCIVADDKELLKELGGTVGDEENLYA